MAKQITSEIDLCFETTVVDQESHTIRNVVLCGNESKNGYKYPPACFKDQDHVVRLYEGVTVCIDHSATPGSRKMRDVAGYIRNVRFEGGRPVGDIEVESAIDCGVDLIKLAGKKRKGIGMSHVAHCKMSRNGKTVELVEQVLTVDVVVNPATTQTFFEQEQEPQMEVEQLKAEIETLKAESAVLKADLARGVTASDGFKSECNSLLAEVTALRAEVADLQPQVDKFVAAEQATATKTAVEKLLTEAGLDMTDTIVVSEQFMHVLLTAAPEKRAELIADRKAVTETRGAASNGSTMRSPERQVKSEGAFDALAYIAKAKGTK